MANLDNSREPNDKPFVEAIAEVPYAEPEPVETDAEDAEAAELANVDTEDTAEPEPEAAPVKAEAAPAGDTPTDDKPARHLSKEESKIVALKRQNQKLLDDYRALAAKLDEYEAVKQHQTYKSQYVDQGMDEDAAERLAKKDVADAKQAERLAMLEFRLEHESVLRQYPEAKGDITRIMQTVKASGMDVEQVCRGLYGAEPASDRRARQAAKGELEEPEVDASVAKAQRGAEPEKRNTLTARDLANKKEYERLWRGGKRMSADEYLDVKRKFNPFNE